MHKYPDKYKNEILEALSHYPELKDVNIHFVLAKQASVPYGTKPEFSSCFRARKKRIYTITLLEEAEPPTRDALFKNLREEMRIGVLAHELMHVVQFNNCGRFSLLKTLASYAFPSSKRKTERAADLGAIRHNCGKGLLAHAVYIRTIPGYTEQRPAINRDYLLPEEMALCIKYPDAILI